MKDRKHTAPGRRHGWKSAAYIAAPAAVALVLSVIFRSAALGYDSDYAIAWGGTLLNGELPLYGPEWSSAPTPHPLFTALGAIASVFGSAADDALQVILALGFGALCAGLVRLGEVSGNVAVGLLAAAVVAVRLPFVEAGVQGSYDVIFVALLVWAGALEASSPRRGISVLALLTLAGLLRPEAWLFAGAYFLWTVEGTSWRYRSAAALMVAGAPAIWLASDLLVTGSPTSSLTDTQAFAEELDRKTGVTNFPILLVHFRDILSAPGALAGAVGVLAAVLWYRRRMAVPLALLAANVASFFLVAVAGLSLISRYLLVGGAMLAFFAAVAVFAWWRPPAAHGSPLPRRAVAVAAGVLLLLALPSSFRGLRSFHDHMAAKGQVQHELEKLLGSPRAQVALKSCRRIFVPTGRYVPIVVHVADRSEAAIESTRSSKPTSSDAFVSVRGDARSDVGSDAPDFVEGRVAVPNGARLVAANRLYAVHAGTQCNVGP